MRTGIVLPTLSVLAAIAGMMSTSAHAYQMTVQVGSSNDGSPGNPTGSTVSSAVPNGVTSLSANVSGADNSNPLFPKSGSASAAVDLRAGSVQSSASSNAGSSFGIPYTGFANGYALLSETLTFSQPGASIGFFASLGGSASLVDPAASYDNSYSVTISSGANSGVFSHTATVAGGAASIANTALFNGAAWAGSTVNPIDANNATFLGYLTVDLLSPTVTIQELISLDAFGASNTERGVLSLILPAGVTYTSTSGASFSTRIPEPASVALLVPALIGIAGLRRHRV